MKGHNLVPCIALQQRRHMMKPRGSHLMAGCLQIRVLKHSCLQLLLLIHFQMLLQPNLMIMRLHCCCHSCTTGCQDSNYSNNKQPLMVPRVRDQYLKLQASINSSRQRLVAWHLCCSRVIQVIGWQTPFAKARFHLGIFKICQKGV